MARIRITNSPLAGHKACSLESVGKAGLSRGIEVMTQAEATLRNLQSRAVNLTPDQLFSEFMFANLGQASFVSGARMFEGLLTRVNVQAGLQSLLTVSPAGTCQVRSAVDEDMIVPKHTSAAPSDAYAGVVSASSSYGGGWEPWAAVDGSSGPPSWSTPINPTLPAWVKYDFRMPVKAGKYSMNGGTEPGYVPRDWQLQASLNDVDWDTIDTRTGINNWTSWETKTFTFASRQSYRYWRLYITAGNNSTYVYLPDFRIYTPSENYNSRPAAWTSFTNGTPSASWRIGCIVAPGTPAPDFMELGRNINGRPSFGSVAVSQIETRAEGRSYVGIGTDISQTTIYTQVVYPWVTGTFRCLAAERVIA